MNRTSPFSSYLVPSGAAVSRSGGLIVPSVDVDFPLTLSPSLWLDSMFGLYQERTGSGATTPANAVGDPVGTWLDRSGNARHLTASADSVRPTYQPNSQNGLPGVLFDGTDDCLSGPASVLTASAGLVIAAYKLTDLTNDQTLWATADEASVNFYLIGSHVLVASDLRIRIQQAEDGVANGVRGSTNFVADTCYVVDWQSNGSAWQIRLNGSAETLTVSVGSNTGAWAAATSNRDNFTVGALVRSSASSFFKGRLLEMLALDYNPTVGQVTQLESYLNVKWGAF